MSKYSVFIMFLAIVHRPVFYKKKKKHRPLYFPKHVSETAFCLRL
jgi:hypothetical protein